MLLNFMGLKRALKAPSPQGGASMKSFTALLVRSAPSWNRSATDTVHSGFRCRERDLKRWTDSPVLALALTCCVIASRWKGRHWKAQVLRGKKSFKSLDFAEIQFGSKEQQEGEGEKSYCRGIFHGQPSMIRAEISDMKLGILEQIREPSCSKSSPSLDDDYIPALRRQQGSVT